MDLCQWANKADGTTPIEFIPESNRITAKYANGVTLILDFLKTPFGERPGWITRLGTCPVRFVGDEGWVETGDSGEIVVSSESLKKELGDQAKPTSGLDVAAHARNFFDAIKTRGDTAANERVMRSSHIACHAAALAWMLNRPLKFDPAKEAFVGDDEATSCGPRPARNWRGEARA